ncbi:MAG: hypothetical protein IJ457_04875 [Clostridia bacterium]|nr:hypothetical protein [Clostridia bacterium]
MKRILSVILCTVMIAVFAVVVNAESINMAGGCKVEVDVMKADPSVVIKDGVIGADEYVEVDVNRDPAATDLLYSWSGDSTLFASCEEFVKNVHFYFSWDEVHGLNIALKATLLETPHNEGVLPAPGAGDDFLFQFGMMCSVVQKDDMTQDVMYRGISKNTVTGELLIGDYGVHGYKGNADIQPGRDFTVSIEGNTVTYEMSYPLDAVLKAEELDGGLPVEGSSIHMNISATGGSTGTGYDAATTYAISLGDGGYMTTINLIENPSPVKLFFRNDAIGGGAAVDTTPVTTAPESEEDSTMISILIPIETGTGPVITEIVTSSVVIGTDESGNDITDILTEVVTPVVTNAPTESAGQGTSAPATGDVMIIAAVVSAISACGVVVATCECY